MFMMGLFFSWPHLIQWWSAINCCLVSKKKKKKQKNKQKKKKNTPSKKKQTKKQLCLSIKNRDEALETIQSPVSFHQSQTSRPPLFLLKRPSKCFPSHDKCLSDGQAVSLQAHRTPLYGATLHKPGSAKARLT